MFEQICRQNPPSLRLPSLKAGIASRLATLLCHEVATGERRLLGHCSVVGPRSDANDADLSSCAPRTEESTLAKLKPCERAKAERFRPNDRLLEFLNAL